MTTYEQLSNAAAECATDNQVGYWDAVAIVEDHAADYTEIADAATIREWASRQPLVGRRPGTDNSQWLGAHPRAPRYEVQYSTRRTEIAADLDEAVEAARDTLSLDGAPVLAESTEIVGECRAVPCWYVYSSQAEADADRGGRSLARIVEVAS